MVIIVANSVSARSCTSVSRACTRDAPDPPVVIAKRVKRESASPVTRADPAGQFVDPLELLSRGTTAAGR